MVTETDVKREENIAWPEAGQPFGYAPDIVPIQEAVRRLPTRIESVARRSAGWTACIVLMAVALLFRLYWMHALFAYPDSDQDILGIMALDIQKGKQMAFYYGQPYMGSLEAYIAAGLFSLFGPSAAALRVPTLLFSLAFVGSIYWIGLKLYGYRVALCAGLFVALGPIILVQWGIAAGAGYIDVAFLGSLLFLLALHYPDLRRMPWTVALGGGLLAGVGAWTEPLMVEYLFPSCLLYGVPLVRSRGEGEIWARIRGPLAAGVFGVVVGLLPLILYNLSHSGASFTYLLHGGQGGHPLRTAVRVVLQSFPILLGLATPVTPNADIYAFTSLAWRHLVLYLFGVVLSAYIILRLARPKGGLLGRIAVLWRREPSDPRALGEALLALFAVTSVLLFVVSHFGAGMTDMPRYMLPLYTATPFLLACTFPSLRWRPVWLGVVGVFALCAAGVTTVSGLPASASISPLIHKLEARGDRIVYANYWQAYRVTFETRERILGIPVEHNLTLSWVRTPWHLVVARRTPARQLAWMLMWGSRDERRLQARMRAARIRAETWRWGRRIIYDHFSGGIRSEGRYKTLEHR